jgi:hypothetical protein
LFILDYIYNKGGIFILKKIKTGLAISLIAVILHGCNTDEVVKKQSSKVETKTKTNSHYKWKEPVSQIDFIILNPDKLSDKKIKSFKKDINDFMPYLVEETEGLLERRSSITITLYKKEGLSNSGPGFIDIYNDMEETFFIGWFLTDSAFPNNSYYKDFYRNAPRVGLNCYLDAYYGFSQVHPLEEFLAMRDEFSKTYPVSIKKNIDDMWQSDLDEDITDYNYFINSSFYMYLIDTYGLKKYLPLLDLPQTDKSFLQLFGKTLQQLETDWLKSIS